MNHSSDATALELRLTPPTEDNVQAVAQLLQANESGQGGALTGDFPAEKVRMMLDQRSPVVSAWLADQLLGVVFSAEPAASLHVPVLAAMHAAWPGNSDDYFYGPVCISEAARGQGLLPKLYAELQRQLPGKAAVLFITDDNIASRRAHERLGMYATTSFEWQGRVAWVYTDEAMIRTNSIPEQSQT
jgi:hypothetical protein